MCSATRQGSSPNHAAGGPGQLGNGRQGGAPPSPETALTAILGVLGRLGGIRGRRIACSARTRPPEG